MHLKSFADWKEKLPKFEYGIQGGNVRILSKVTTQTPSDLGLQSKSADIHAKFHTQYPVKDLHTQSHDELQHKQMYCMNVRDIDPVSMSPKKHTRPDYTVKRKEVSKSAEGQVHSKPKVSELRGIVYGADAAEAFVRFESKGEYLERAVSLNLFADDGIDCLQVGHVVIFQIERYDKETITRFKYGGKQLYELSEERLLELDKLYKKATKKKR